MDSLTHLVAGALTPIAFKHAPKRTALIIFGILAGEFPDIDIFFGSSAEYTLSQHRGLSHGAALQPLFAFLLAAVFTGLTLVFSGRLKQKSLANQATYFGKATNNSAPFGFVPLFCVALFALFTHIYLDIFNGFGTQVLQPFSNARIGLNSVFIIDLLLTLPALFVMVWLFFTPAVTSTGENWKLAVKSSGKAQQKYFSPKARKMARLALCWLLLYPLASTATMHLLEKYYSTKWNLPAGQELKLMPEPFSPFVWKATIKAGAQYKMGTLFPFTHQAFTLIAEPDNWMEFAVADMDLYGRLEKQSSFLQIFREFSQDMYQRQVKDPTGDGEIYYFTDLRYTMSPHSLGRKIRGGEPNFVLGVKLDNEGNFTAYRFLHGSAEKDSLWESVQPATGWQGQP